MTSPSQVAQVDGRPASPRVTGPAISPSGAEHASGAPHDGPPADARPIDPYAERASRAGLSRRFDGIFERYRGTVPIEYVRALTERESSFEPRQRTGHAIGLMQIVPVVLDDYNTRHGTHYQSDHLVDPNINVAIGCELLRIIITGYQKNHPRIPNLATDWNNPRFVELLTLGWNAGFSEAGGVGRVAHYLEHHGVTDLTIDLVSQSASAAGASKHVSNAAKVRWCKSVVALYARERALPNPRPTTPHTPHP